MKIEARPARLTLPGTKVAADSSSDFNPKIENHPDLPAIDWTAIGVSVPVHQIPEADSLPQADALLFCWTESEWAATNQVFCKSGTSMSYSAKNNGSWNGWVPFKEAVSGHQDSVSGYYTLSNLGSKKLLLFKSEVHLHEQGEAALSSLVQILLEKIKPSLVISSGTSGGTIPTKHVGTVNVVNAGCLYDKSEPSSEWPVYSNSWDAGWTILSKPGFQKILFPIPTIAADMNSIVNQFNQFYQMNYPNSTLDINSLNMGDPIPQINNMTTKGTAFIIPRQPLATT